MFLISFTSINIESAAKQKLQLTFCRFAMGGIFTTNVGADHKTFGYHKTVCGARNPAYCKCAVTCCRFFCPNRCQSKFATPKNL